MHNRLRSADYNLELVGTLEADGGEAWYPMYHRTLKPGSSLNTVTDFRVNVGNHFTTVAPKMRVTSDPGALQLYTYFGDENKANLFNPYIWIRLTYNSVLAEKAFVVFDLDFRFASNIPDTMADKRVFDFHAGWNYTISASKAVLLGDLVVQKFFPTTSPPYNQFRVKIFQGLTNMVSRDTIQLEVGGHLVNTIQKYLKGYYSTITLDIMVTLYYTTLRLLPLPASGLDDSWEELKTDN